MGWETGPEPEGLVLLSCFHRSDMPKSKSLNLCQLGPLWLTLTSDQGPHFVLKSGGDIRAQMKFVLYEMGGLE